ncbi:hypothetical protein A2U01_0104778, partial [Trifolium medium]|nr:hypothetical protein [Trifolium medium]
MGRGKPYGRGGKNLMKVVVAVEEKE